MRNGLGYSLVNDRTGAATWSLPMQMSEREKEWVIKADLPDVDLTDISLLVSSQALTITAPSKGSMTRDAGYYRAERQLPEGVFTQEIRARYCEGVLEISLPKCREMFRRVSIEP